tara:strand:- start:199 stop:384 length:186 start_codon:yes stop_codon:yes gene_type:complete
VVLVVPIGPVTIVTTTILIGKFLLIPQRSFLRSGALVVAVEMVAAVLVAYLVHLVLMHIRN